MEDTDYTVRALVREDREWVAHFLDEHWGTTQMVSRGKSYYGHLLPGFVAERGEGEDKERIGLLTYDLEDDEVQVITINSTEESSGVGSALIEALVAAARENGNIKRVWLITTNDNLPALKFYQKRGFELVAVHRDSIKESRRIKPQIPITGLDGIPIRDEIELEIRLD